MARASLEPLRAPPTTSAKVSQPVQCPPRPGLSGEKSEMVRSEHSLPYGGGVSRVSGVLPEDTVKAAGSRRAPAMPPDERRTAIARAALQLLLEHGANVTTRQIADAADVAEGTIFRVFADKDAVISAAVDLALDPVLTEQGLAEIDRTLPFERQLEAAVEVIQRRMADIARLVSAVGGPAFFAGRERSLPDLTALVALFAPHARRLRCEPEKSARLLPALTLAFSHPALYGDEPMSATEIVSLLLDGIRARGPGISPSRGRPQC
jgi:AcrR family transcriptional regulator